ncbi:MAG: hypothetical protein D6767_01465 [Candidatus Hydrogenedentota bacterium]|nr:MAG: hypothetical protein D6767_01465 [Candidatus Hydrogenedentota bacterium]
MLKLLILVAIAYLVYFLIRIYRVLKNAERIQREKMREFQAQSREKDISAEAKIIDEKPLSEDD